MYCRFCGKEIDNDSDFCNYCGKSTANPDSKPDSLTKNEENTEVKKEPETKRPVGAEAVIFVIICIGIVISMLAGFVFEDIVSACVSVFGVLLITLAIIRTRSIHNVMVCLFGGVIHIFAAIANSLVRLIDIQVYMEEYDEAVIQNSMYFHSMMGQIIRFIFGLIILFVAFIALKKKKLNINGKAAEKTYFTAWVGFMLSAVFGHLLFIPAISSYVLLGLSEIIIHVIGLIILFIAVISAKTNYTRILCIIMGLFEVAFGGLLTIASIKTYKTMVDDGPMMVIKYLAPVMMVLGLALNIIAIARYTISLLDKKSDETEITDPMFFSVLTGILISAFGFYIFGWINANSVKGENIFIAGLIIMLISSILTKRNYTRIVCIVMGFINLILAVWVLIASEGTMFLTPVFVIALTTVIVSGVRISLTKTKN